MRILEKKNSTEDITESGFVLVLAVVMLLVISLFGIWALQTSTSELQVAGGSQQIEKQFNIIEGAANSEAGKVGFFTTDFYQIADPNDIFQLLIPTTNNDFDPGSDDGDAATNFAAITTQANNYSGNFVPPNTWPWENLLQDYSNPSANNESDYRYLTTYLYGDTAPVGYDATLFAGYKFRIQGAAPVRPIIVELGGTKIGPK